MKTIPYNQAITILEESAGIIIDDDVICYPDISDEGDITIKYVYEYNEYEIHIYDHDNENVQLVGSCLFFKDSNGEDVQITPVFTKSIEDDN